jgi:hypothetical protein
MKHVKQFEEYSENVKYRVGYYVYIKRNKFTPAVFSDIGQIKSKYYTLGGNHMYEVLLSSGHKTSADDSTILRKLTKSEIAQHKLEIETEKYNL